MAKQPQDLREFKAYERALSRLLKSQPDWVSTHQQIVNAWWCAGIIGGMFRAGVDHGYKVGRRSKQP